MGVLANARHETFAQLVVSGRPQSRAYVEAGYSAKGNSAETAAARLFRHVQVAQRISELRSQALAVVQQDAEEAVASAAWIIAKSVEVVNAGLAASPVRDRNGAVIMVASEGGEMVPAGWDSFNLAAANGALKLLSQQFPATFAPEASGTDRSQHLHLHGLSESDLREIASGLRA